MDETELALLDPLYQTREFMRRTGILGPEEVLEYVRQYRRGQAAEESLERDDLDRRRRIVLRRAVRVGLTARMRLIESNLPLVMRVASRYVGGSLDFEDLFQEGVLGLMEAVRRYDPVRGRLSTYASWWILQRIKRALEEKAAQIRIPSYLQQLERDAQRGRQTPTKKQEKLLAKSRQVFEGYHESIPDDREVHERIDESDASAETARRINPILRGMGRNGQVLRRRLGEGGTLKQIGQEQGVTAEAIRQLTVRSSRQLRRRLANGTPPTAR